MAKQKEPSFDFGFNVLPKPKKSKGGGKKQTKATKQAFALAKKKGGPLYGRSGS
jgi:hypothetical protein